MYWKDAGQDQEDGTGPTEARHGRYKKGNRSFDALMQNANFFMIPEVSQEGLEVLTRQIMRD